MQRGHLLVPSFVIALIRDYLFNNSRFACLLSTITSHSAQIS